ncbi:MAG: ribulose-phosphate 3-epimerase [Planctomycetes bacterium]|jgi:ribulose-phosphate 3-epimerase|nr:ribulose-phosphate 3-epimerase [Planctomycetota bacterium]
MNKHRLPKAGTFQIVPSVLSADFANLASEIAQVTAVGIEVVHLDVMDGHFVPNLTFGPPVVASIRKCTDAVLDTHLMITHPETYAERFAEAGSDHITFHIETVSDPKAFVKTLRGLGVSVGVTLNPATPVEAVKEVAPLCDMVLVMTVNPGFGGQSFMDQAARKCIRLRQLVGPEVRIEVDGGIDPTTIGTAKRYGADTFVAGNAIFGTSDRAAAIAALRGAIEK